jgi:hypothetical protein
MDILASINNNNLIFFAAMDGGEPNQLGGAISANVSPCPTLRQFCNTLEHWIFLSITFWIINTGAMWRSPSDQRERRGYGVLYDVDSPYERRKPLSNY